MRATLLLPSARRFSGTQDTLARRIGRGDRLEALPEGRDATLRGCFAFIGTSIPAAALTRNLDAGDAAGAQRRRCDPACIMADAVTLRLVACGAMSLSDDDVATLTRSLSPIFGDAGFLLEASRPDRWYLRCAREARLPAFSSPDDALGDDLARHLPQGESAARFRALLNEAQIALTQNPLNARRAQRRQSPVNSVWFWGPGMLPEWVRSRFGQVYSDDEVVVALAA
ncbi:MAG: phosphoglycerate mutase, partial [Rudaea sp.]